MRGLEKVQGVLRNYYKDCQLYNDCWTESVSREKGHCSKSFPFYFTERTRFIALSNIKPVILIDFRSNLTGSRNVTILNLKYFISIPLTGSKSKAYDSSAAGKGKHDADNYFYLNQCVVFIENRAECCSCKRKFKIRAASIVLFTIASKFPSLAL